MSTLFTRVTLTALFLLASVLVHLVLLGMIVLAERRGLPATETESLDVELVRPAELPEPKPPEPEPPEPEKKPEPKPEPKPEQAAQAEAPAEPPAEAPQQPQAAGQTPPEPTQPEQTQPETPSRPEGPSGGPPSESKSKLTAQEIAALRAQIQKCWQLPVGIPNAMKLEAVIRVSLGRNGQLAAEPELLKASASMHGPVLVGIAMRALRECAPYRGLPAAKYGEWKLLDLRFGATGMAALGMPKAR